MTATIDAQERALASTEEFKKSADAHRASLEGKVKGLEEAVTFMDEHCLPDRGQRAG